jgi:phage FluMu protein gp41
MGQGRGFGRGGVLIPGADILERRIAAMRDVPWPIPALTLIEMTDEDLDHLDAAADTDRYWCVLNGIVRRTQEKEAT